MSPVATMKCTSIVAQVNLGYYDEEGNLLGEETFPQSNGNVLTAKLFFPHAEQLTNLIEHCIHEAKAKLSVQAPTDPLNQARDGHGGDSRTAQAGPTEALPPAGAARNSS